MSDADGPVLPLARFTGTIGDGENTVAITIDAAADSDGRLQITPVEVSHEVYMLAVREFGSFEEMREFSLTASDEKGRRFTSDAVYVTSHNHSSHGFSLTLKARAACFEEDLVNPIDRPLKRVFFRGFKSFRGHEKNTRFGKVALAGAAKDVETDMITGWAGVQSHEPEPDDTWHADADALLIHMQRGMGFAHGGRLQTPLFEEITSSLRRITFYEGSGWRAEHPIFPHLNQGPFFQSLVSRFEEHGPLDDVFWTASGWVHVETTFDDVRFMTAMTAIETLASNALPERLTTAVSKPIFKGLKSQLKATVEDQENLDREDKGLLQGKIDNMNTRSLYQKIDSLFDHFDLPREDFEGDTIRNLIGMRNDLVHRGQAHDQSEIWSGIMLARELVARVILREIGFDGQYYCHTGGRDLRSFPASHANTGADPDDQS